MIYYVDSTGKVGRATNGENRSKGYAADALIYIIFDYDYAADDAIEILNNVLPEIVTQNGVKIEADLSTLTHDSVMVLEANGLSIYPRLVFKSIVENIDDFIGGAATIKGMERAIDLNKSRECVTDGLQGSCYPRKRFQV